MPFINATPEQEAEFRSGIVSGRYSLLLGAGASRDSKNKFGPIPLGSELEQELSDVLGVKNGKYSLQKLYATLTDGEKSTHIRDRFSNCEPGKVAGTIERYYWKRIFTLNIDDTLNKSFSETSKQSAKFLHFLDPYEDFQTRANLPVVHLHGSVLRHEDGYVFSHQEYARIIKGQNPWMMILANSMRSDPMIISGASMEEVDIEYYLSFRSLASSRDDFPPSIFVSNEVNRLTEALCEDHNLIQFSGYSSDFFEYLSEQIPNPPRLDGGASTGVLGLLPKATPKTAKMHFDADFEMVPKAEVGGSSGNQFYYGHPPTWGDLAAKLDISRTENSILIDKSSETTDFGRQLHVLFGKTGSGKTTILKRVAYNLASKGICHVLWTSELGRLSKSTANTLDLIDGPVALVVDNLADHAQAISDVLSLSEKEDIYILGAERSYREEYLLKTFGSGGFTKTELGPLTKLDARRLIDALTEVALIGSHRALRGQRGFINSLRSDPIAIASCRVINDFKPLTRILDDLISSSSRDELLSFSLVSIAEHCHKSGVRSEIVAREVGGQVIVDMLNGKRALSLKEVDKTRTTGFLGAENSTLSEVLLSKLNERDPDLVFSAFEALANGLSPYVNRNTIRARAPEAKLAGRLFDFDDIVEKFLGPRTEEFYDKAREAWRWNSRFWEQYALMKLDHSFRAENEDEKWDNLSESLQRARHSLAVEKHPFGLNTLAKVLMTFVSFGHRDSVSHFSEALGHIKSAIEFEQRHRRSSQHPYSTLIFGTADLLENGFDLPFANKREVTDMVLYANERWDKDEVLRDKCQRLLARI
ncbi:SIR2 family protein [Phaeobacter inhibens]|uniref:P-loop NTPase n=1 Tax=Phaeobacter inhibens TaxID=221822 RepID=UPI000CA23583|nr:SIR2 family protein [Phaeobacter inhibens]AUR06968.1 hypothetical protein PhaeoP59_00768 [Phaeobacter inhibens]